MFANDAVQSPEPTPIYITPAPGLTYREGVIGHPSSINPLTASTQADRDLVALLFRGLLKAGPDGTLVPDLAASWSVSGDGLTYTFDLRHDARWEDGQPVTATDVAFTVALAQDPNYDGPLGASWQGIRVTVVNAYVVRFTLPTPLGGFARQALLPILPEHLLGDTDVTDLADSDYSANPIGDGPFRIIEIDDSNALLVRVSGSAPSTAASSTGTSSVTSPSAAGSAAAGTSGSAPGATASSVATAGASVEIPGNVQYVELVFFADQASVVKAFQAGTIDALGGLPPIAADTVASGGGSHLLLYPFTSMISVVLNQRSAHPEFGSLNVRQGLLTAIDRPQILAATLRGRGTIADVPLPSWSSSYDSSAVVAPTYDTAAAQADLTSAGWARGASGWTVPPGNSPYAIRLLSPDSTTNPIAFAIAGEVVRDWQALGLQVSLQAVDATDYGQDLDNGDFDAAVVDYQLGLDPDVSPLLLSSQVAPAGSNLSGVSDKSLDALLMAVRTTSDPTARQAAISALEKYVSTNVLMLPICFADYEFVVADRVQGVSTNEIADPSGRYWDVLDWRLASDG